MKLTNDDLLRNNILQESPLVLLPSNTKPNCVLQSSLLESDTRNLFLENHSLVSQQTQQGNVKLQSNTKAKDLKNASLTLSLTTTPHHLSLQLNKSYLSNFLLQDLSLKTSLKPMQNTQNYQLMSLTSKSLSNPYKDMLASSLNSQQRNPPHSLCESNVQHSKTRGLHQSKKSDNFEASLEKVSRKWQLEKGLLLEQYSLTPNSDPVQFTYPASPLSVKLNDLSQDPVFQLKAKFINIVSASLISLPNFSSLNDEKCFVIYKMVEEMAECDPEFVLKVALYTRQELNVRATANFLLACSAHFQQCRTFLSKYYSASVQLPSDWIDIAEKYVKCLNEGNKSLPAALRKAMVKKFADFDEYQLAKYNKTTKKVKKGKKEEESKPPANNFTLKKLIGQLHISQPSYHVMCLLGKKYPENVDAFYKSGLEGTWDSAKAGTRMKLAIPNTWETQVSLKGNKPETWESLIDSKSLPYMATLRNIRNLLKSGISQKHRQNVIKYLTNKNAVARSRQFPFRYLSAYEVVGELLVELSKRELYKNKGIKAFLSPDLLVFHSIKSKPSTPEAIEGKKKIASLKQRLKKFEKEVQYDEKLVKDFQTALETSLDIATMCNLTPIKGHTLVLCEATCKMNATCGVIRKESKRSILEIGILMGLMCSSACEDCSFSLYSMEKIYPVELEKGGILSNMKSILKLAELIQTQLEDPDLNIPIGYLNKFVLERQHVDNIVLLTKGLSNEDNSVLHEFLERYRAHVNKSMMYYEIQLSGKHAKFEDGSNKQNVKVCGFSDHILRFIAEGGGEQQVNYVETIDKRRNLEQKHEKIQTPVVSLTQKKEKLAERDNIRVFVSSTLKDMLGERNILSSYVFPELRRKAADLDLNVTECDLRWGIPLMERGKNKTVEVCLGEVEKCQLFVGMIGDRYGWIPKPGDFPKEHQLPDDLKGKSITEIEIYQGALNSQESPLNKAFFYIRDEKSVNKLSKNQKKEFAESDAKKQKLKELKETIRSSRHKVCEGYEASWTKSQDGKLVADNLNEFAEAVLEDLSGALRSIAKAKSRQHSQENIGLASLEVLVNAHTKDFVGRQLLLDKTVLLLHLKNQLQDSQFLALHGPMGCGKTSILSMLINHFEKLPQCCVVKCFIGCLSRNNQTSKVLLDSLIAQMKFQLDLKDYTAEGSTLKDSMDMFWYCVALLTKEHSRLVYIFIDDLDALMSSSSKNSLQWLPAKLPPGVVLVVTCTEKSNAHYFLQQQHEEIVFVKVPQLNGRESAMVVRSLLSAFSKSLDENYFNNQLRSLLLKKGSSNPLYLKTACDYIRMFADFSTLDEALYKMPHTLTELLQFWLHKLERFLGKSSLIAMFLSVIYCSPGGIQEEFLYQVLCQGNRIFSNSELERSVFCQVLHLLGGFLFKSTEEGGKIYFNHEIYADAVFNRYLSTGNRRQEACHELLAFMHLSSLASRQHFSSSDFSLALLPYHIKMSGDSSFLVDLLCSFKFVESKCFAKLSWQLGGDFELVENDQYFNCHTLKMLKSCLAPSLSLIEEHPTMIYQSLCDHDLDWMIQQKDSVNMGPDKDDTHVFFKPVCKPPLSMENTRMLKDMSTMQPTYLAVSPNNQKLACGSDKGILIAFDASTGERRQVFNATSAIKEVLYVTDNLVVTGHVNGKIMVWNDEDGYLISEINAHRKSLTGLALHANFAYILSTGLDRQVHIWQVSANKEQQPIGPSPTRSIDLEKMTPSCVEAHPHKRHLALGMWNSTIQVWDFVELKRIAVMRGSRNSVTTLKYSTNGDYIFSVSLNTVGVNIWSSATGHLIGTMGTNTVVSSILYLSDLDYVISAGNSKGNLSDGVIEIWKSSLGKKIATFESSTEEVESLCCTFFEDHSKLAVGYDNGQLSIFNTVTNEVVGSSNVHDGQVRCILFVEFEIRGSSETVEVILTGSDDRMINVFCPTTLKTLNKLEAHKGAVVALASNGKFLASASEDLTILLWCRLLKTNDELVPNYILRSHTATPTCLAFNGIGSFMVSGGKDKSLVYWKTPNLYIVRKSNLSPHFVHDKAHMDWITCCAYSSTNVVATGSNDCSVKLWSQGQLLHQFSGHQGFLTSLNFAHDFVVSTDKAGKMLLWSQSGVQISSIECGGQVNASDVAVKLMEVEKESEDPTDELQFHDWDDQVEYENWKKEHDAAVLQKTRKKNTLGLEKVDSIVVITAQSATVQMWNPLESENVAQITGHTDVITSVRHNASKIFSCGRDGVINFWNLPQEQSPNKGNFIGHEKEITEMVRTGKYVASGCMDGIIKVWSNVPSGLLLVCSTKAHTKQLSGISVIGQVGANIFLATSSFDGFVKTWQAKTDSNELIELDKADLSSAVTLLHCKDSLLTCATSDGKSWELTLKKNLKFQLPKTRQKSETAKVSWFSLYVNDQLLTDQAISPSGPNVVACASGAFISCMNFIDEGSALAFGDNLGNIYPLKKTLRRIHADKITSINSWRQYVVTTSFDRMVKVWRKDNFKQVGYYMAPSSITHCCVNADDDTVVIADIGGRLHVIKITTSL